MSREMTALWHLTWESFESEDTEDLFVRGKTAEQVVDFWREHHGLTDPITSPFRGRIIPDLDPMHPEYASCLRIWRIHPGHEDGVLGVVNGRPGGRLELVGYVLPTP